MTTQNQKIQVFARCRPLNKKEKNLQSPSIVEVFPKKNEISVSDKNNRRQFYFDKVFPPETDQITVYKNVVEPLIKEVLLGYNCTVFAYGQTGTGKTYTMEGERSGSNCSWEKDGGAGVIPRSLHQLFEELNKEENVEFSVRVSFLELYNEELFDLLGTTEFSKLRLYEDPVKKGSVIIQGLEEVIVNSKDAVYNILEHGTSRRQTAATMLNATSSRSHTVFSVTVHIKENTVDGEELLKTGKLNLVDLAGSENIGRSGAVDKRAREAGNINQSLLTLGRVITALIEKQPHIPYRESKLTRLLQDSLGGHTKTSMIATISPAQLNSDETISTLDYATKAKSITIRPEANQKMTKRALLREYAQEIDRLKKDLAAARCSEGFYIDAESYKIMEQSISDKSNMIKDLNGKIEAFIQKNIALEQEKSAVIDELCKKNQENKDLHANLMKTSDKLKSTKENLSKAILEKEETKYLLDIYKENEKKLSSQAQELLHVADQTTSDINGFCAKLNRKQYIEKTNEEQSENFKQSYKRQFAKLDEMIVEMKSLQCQNFNNIEESLDLVILDYNSIKDRFTDILANLTNQELNFENFLLNMSKNVVDHKSKMTTEMDHIKSKKIDHSVELQAFLIETLSQSFNKLHRIKKETDDLVLNKLNKLIQGIRQYHSHFMTRSDEKINLVELMKNSLSSFYKHHKNLLKDLERKTRSLVSLEEENEKCLTAELSHITEFLNNRLRMGIARKEKINEAISLHTDLIKNCTELKTTEENLESLKNMQQRFVSDVEFMKDHADEVNLEEVIAKQNSTNSAVHSLSTEMTNFVNLNKKNHDKIFTEMEGILHDNSLITQTNYEKYESELKNITSSLSEKAKEEYESIKVENIILNQISKTKSIANKSKELSVQNANELKEQILQRDLEIETFFKESHKDISTGATPQKRTYEYPKSLIAVSPDEKLLQILRSKRKNYPSAIDVYLDCSFDASDSTILNTSLDSEDEYLTCETRSNCSSMSDLSVIEIKNKENLKRSANTSPQPKPKKFKIADSNQPTSARRKLNKY